MHFNETLFYVCGIALAVSAVLISFVGLKVKSFPGRVFPLVVVWFVVFVGGATTFSVLHAKDLDEEKAHEFEQANEEIEKEQTTEPFEEAEEEGSEVEAEREGAEAEATSSVLKISADTTALAYDTTELSAAAGEITVDFTNPSAIPHDFAVERDGEVLDKTEVIAESEESVTLELEPGTYTFLCTVPGHAAAGMEGTLTVE